MTETRVCHFCGTATDTWCPTCTAAWPNRPDPETMTPEERAAEMEALYGPLEVEFSLVHQRIEALVGRSVWTHEMGTRTKDALIREAATRQHPGMGEVIRRAAAYGKPVIVVGADEGAER